MPRPYRKPAPPLASKRFSRCKFNKKSLDRYWSEEVFEQRKGISTLEPYLQIHVLNFISETRATLCAKSSPLRLRRDMSSMDDGD
jgi:hypothetical protein